MTKYKGLFTFDEDNHRYVPIAQADGVIDTMGYETGSEPVEPLIKDEKIRKVVRAWAEANDIEDVAHYTFGDVLADFKAWDKFGKECDIMFYRQVGLDEARHYTITELCGEEEE